MRRRQPQSRTQLRPQRIRDADPVALFVEGALDVAVRVLGNCGARTVAPASARQSELSVHRLGCHRSDADVREQVRVAREPASLAHDVRPDRAFGYPAQFLAPGAPQCVERPVRGDGVVALEQCVACGRSVEFGASDQAQILIGAVVVIAAGARSEQDHGVQRAVRGGRFGRSDERVCVIGSRHRSAPSGSAAAKCYVTSREMSGPLETLAASAPLCAAIAAAVGLGCVRKVYRMPIL